MRRFLMLLTAFIFSITLKAQNTEDSVKAAVQLLFKGMLSSDAAMIKAAFADSAVLQTISYTKEGKTIVRNDQVDEFAKQVSEIKKGMADEQIVFETIKIDADLAMVWAPYKFYYEGKFSHCGVDAFQLVRFNGVWKIQYLIDTRRRQPCD